MSVLKIQKLHLDYPNIQDESQKTTALSDINLNIDKGEFVVILGASGCGKTSLLNIMAGFIFPTQGQALIESEMIKKPHPERGMVFQKNALMPWLNVRENVELSLKFAGVDKTTRTETSAKVLEWVGLQEFGDHYIYQLSGGMQQRVGIARALASDPAVLLLDEPLGALDAITREEVQEVILKVWQKTHKTVVMVTHSIEEALFMATRLIIMTPRPGKIFKEYNLNYGQRFLDGELAKDLKQEDSLLEIKKEILSIVEERAQ